MRFWTNAPVSNLPPWLTLVRKYEIPKQFLFDPLVGADIWIRNRQFETFEELATFRQSRWRLDDGRSHSVSGDHQIRL